MALNLSNSSSLEQQALKGLIYELDLDILKMCRHTTNVFSGEGFQKLAQTVQTDRQTDAVERITTPHSRKQCQRGRSATDRRERVVWRSCEHD